MKVPDRTGQSWFIRRNGIADGIAVLVTGPPEFSLGYQIHPFVFLDDVDPYAQHRDNDKVCWEIPGAPWERSANHRRIA